MSSSMKRFDELLRANTLKTIFLTSYSSGTSTSSNPCRMAIVATRSAVRRANVVGYGGYPFPGGDNSFLEGWVGSSLGPHIPSRGRELSQRDSITRLSSEGRRVVSSKRMQRGLSSWSVLRRSRRSNQALKMPKSEQY